jgi:hypothetical protein
MPTVPNLGLYRSQVFGTQPPSPEIADSSAAGSASDGVLGCTVAGRITLLTGWNWYTGSDPRAIGSDQYD